MGNKLTQILPGRISRSRVFNNQILKKCNGYILILLLSFFLPCFASAATLTRPANNLSLVGYWPMNEGTSTQAGDFSGSGNTGTLTSGPTWTAGKFGQAVNLDGTNDYIDLGSNTSLNVASSQAFSVSGWVKTTESYGPIMSLRSNSSENPIIDIMVGYDGAVTSSGSLMALVRSDTSSSGQARVTGGTVNDGSWHFFTLTRDAGSTITLYLDGVSQGTNSGANSGAAITTTTYRAIGGERYWTATSFGTVDQRYLVGQVDEVRMYVGKQLSATEIANLYKSGLQKLNSSQNTKGVTSGLVGMWSFNGADTDWSKNKAYDRSGQGNDGVFTNMSTSTAPVIGKVGQALNFDGTNDYVSVPAASSIQITGAISIGAWVKTSSTGVQEIIGSRSGGTNGFGLALRGSAGTNRLRFTYFGVVDWESSNNGHYTDGLWHHYVVTNDLTSVKFYRDGVLFSTSGTAGAPGTVSTVAQALGAMNDGGSPNSYLNGSLDEVRLYNRALSADEAKQLYLMGGSKLNSSQNTKGPTSGLVGMWSFNGPDVSWSANTAYDRSGQGNNGTITNMSTSTAPVIGKVGQAFLFDGTNDYVSMSSAPVTAFPMTSAAWFKTTSTADAYRTITNLDWSGGTQPIVILQFVTSADTCASVGKLKYVVRDNAGTNFSICSTSTLNNGAWHLAVGVSRAANDHEFYVDGVSQGTSATSLGAITLNQFKISNRSSGQYFPGTIDEVRMYNRALSAAEITQLYLMGR